MILEHTLRQRVYYSETDAQGIVYHANFLKFFDHARTESLRSIGFGLSRLFREQGIQFTVRRMNIEYLKSAYLDDELFVVSKVTKAKGVRIEYAQSIMRGSNQGPIICKAWVELVCLNENHKPARIPKALRMELIS